MYMYCSRETPTCLDYGVVLPPFPCSDLGPRTSMGPPSASLLRDWLDVRQLDPDDMHALQQELETGTPDMFMQALDDL